MPPTKLLENKYYDKILNDRQKLEIRQRIKDLDKKLSP